MSTPIRWARAEIAGCWPEASERREESDMAKTDEENGKVNASKGAVKLALAWLAVGVPLVWGIFETLKKAMALFGTA